MGKELRTSVQEGLRKVVSTEQLCIEVPSHTLDHWARNRNTRTNNRSSLGTTAFAKNIDPSAGCKHIGLSS